MNGPNVRHTAFAQELIALCRKHNMSSVSATYRAGFCTDAATEFFGQVQVSWSEGRHGERTNISLRFEACTSVTEEISATDQWQGEG